jgi:hypothetical protein
MSGLGVGGPPDEDENKDEVCAHAGIAKGTSRFPY